MSSKALQPMPSRLDVYAYWAPLGIFDDLEPDHCFACGGKRHLDRAHLIPRSTGGSCDVSNIVLLCHRCHREAPVIATSPRPMIDWIRRRECEAEWTWRRINEESRGMGVENLIFLFGVPDDLGELIKARYMAGAGFPHALGDQFATFAVLAAESLAARPVQ